MWQHSWVLLFLHGVILQKRNHEGILKIPRVKLDTNEVDITSMNSILARKLALTEEIEKAGAKEGKKESWEKERERERGRVSYHHGSNGVLSVHFDSEAVGQATERAGQDNDTAADRTMADGGTPGQKQG